MSDAQQIAERLAAIAIRGCNAGLSQAVIVKKIADAGLRETVEALENVRYDGKDGDYTGAMDTYIWKALVALKGEKA